MKRMVSLKSRMDRVIGLTVLGLVVMLAMPRPSEPGPRPETKTYILTATVAAGEFALFSGVGSLMKEKHPWLRLDSVASQGYFANYKIMTEESHRRSNTLICSDRFSAAAAERKEGKLAPFGEGGKGFKPAALWSLVWCPIFYITSDPNILTEQDLRGKKIINPTKAGNGWVLLDWLREAAGLMGENAQYIAWGKIPEVLIDGHGDCGPDWVDINPINFKTNLSFISQNLMASGKKFKPVYWTEATMEKVKKIQYGFVPLTVAPNAIPNQDKPLTTLTSVTRVVVDAKEFPEELAYELTKFMVENVDELQKLGGKGSLVTAESMIKGCEDDMHPGAFKAYKEKGLVTGTYEEFTEKYRKIYGK